MPFVPGTDLVKVAHKGRNPEGSIFLNTFWCSVPNPISLAQSDADDTYSDIAGAYTSSGLAASLSDAWHSDEVTVTDWTTATSPQFTSAASAFSGGFSGEPLPPGNALVLKLTTDLRGRSFRGRQYLSGFCEASSDGRPVSAIMVQANDYWDDLTTALAVRSWVPVIASQFSGTSLVAGPGGQTLLRPTPRASIVTQGITGHSVEGIWHSQRRRAAQVKVTVRSKQLALNKSTTLNAYVTLYTVPSGYRTIVKSVIATATGSGDLYLSIKSGAATYDIQFWLGVVSGDVKIFDTWIVLEAGQLLMMYQVSHRANWVASGAELLL